MQLQMRHLRTPTRHGPMHRLGCPLLAALLLWALPTGAQAASLAAPSLPGAGFPGPPAEVVPDQVVVGFSAGAGASTRVRARDSANADLKSTLGDSQTQLVEIPRGTDVRDATRILESQPGVAYAEPNYAAYPALGADDPQYADPGQPALARVDAPRAWDYTTGDTRLSVAVIDSGVDLSHPDLAVSGDDDVDGHGTHVAGIAAARGGNQLGIAGVTWRSTLRSYRACDYEAAAPATPPATPAQPRLVCSTAAQARAISDAAAAGTRIANLSIATPVPTGTQSYYSQAVYDAIARNPQMLVVAAAGNGTTADGHGRDVDATGAASYPCSYGLPNVVCVGATRGTSDTPYTYSNYGAASVDLWAPGTAILSTERGGGYSEGTGTSEAAPHVAGAAALLFSAHPSATVTDVKRALMEGVDAISEPTRLTVSGGRLNAFRALAVLDDTRPNTVLDASPTTPTQATSASFAFHSSEPNSTFECQLDGAEWESCPSPKRYDDLPEGRHQFAVRAVDPHPNTDLTPATTSVTVDRTPPDTTFDAGPGPATNRLDATFRFHAEPGSTFECQLDGDGYEPCESPYAVTVGDDDGPHALQVRATDPAGNVESVPTGYSWAVDTAAPAVRFGTVPALLTESREATFVFSGDDPSATITCQLDDAAAKACASPITVTGLDDLKHRLVVRATDAAGNTGTDTYDWTVDGPPRVVVTSAPSPLANSRLAEFAWQTEDDGPGTSDVEHLDCQLDGEAVEPCDSPQPVTVDSDGPHTFTVIAVDREEHRSAAVTHTWVTDTEAPAPPEIAGPTGEPDEPHFTVAGDGATLDCALDDDTWVSCGPSVTFTRVDSGEHVFRARATDTAGNPSVTTTKFTVRLTAPVPVVSGPNGLLASTTATFTFGAGGAECRLDGSAWSPCTSSRTYSNLPQGPHTFAVRATTPHLSDPTTRSFTVDTVPPALRLTAVPATSTTSGSARIAWTTEPGAAVTCSLDRGAARACASSWTLTGLGGGAHGAVLRATDAAGNAASAGALWRVVPPPAPPPTAAAPTAPAARTTAAPTPPPPPAIKPTSTAPLVKAVIRRFKRLSGRKAARVRPFVVRYTSTLPGTLSVRLELRGRRTVRIGGARVTYTRAGAHRVRVRLTAKGRRALRARARPKLRARATFVATSGPTTSSTR